MGKGARLYLGAHRPSSKTKVRLVWPPPRDPARAPLQTSPGLRAPSGSGMRAAGGSDPEPKEQRVGSDRRLLSSLCPKHTLSFLRLRGKKSLFQGRGSGAGQGAPPAGGARNRGGVGRAGWAGVRQHPQPGTRLHRGAPSARNSEKKEGGSLMARKPVRAGAARPWG